MNNDGEVKRVDSIFIRAMKDLKEDMSKEHMERYGYPMTFSFKELTKVMALIYLDRKEPRIFERRIPIEKVMDFLKK